MDGANFLYILQISDCSGNLKRAVIGHGTEAKSRSRYSAVGAALSSPLSDLPLMEIV